MSLLGLSPIKFSSHHMLKHVSISFRSIAYDVRNSENSLYLTKSNYFLKNRCERKRKPKGRRKEAFE